MSVTTKDVVELNDALDWLVGFCSRRPMTRAAILANTTHEVRTLFGEPLGDTFCCKYEISSRRILFENKSVIHLYSAEYPDHLRGSQYDVALVQDRAEETTAGEEMYYAVRTGQNPRLRYVRT